MHYLLRPFEDHEHLVKLEIVFNNDRDEVSRQLNAQQINGVVKVRVMDVTSLLDVPNRNSIKATVIVDFDL